MGQLSTIAPLVSVVVLTYNPSYEKLCATLQSILLQKNIDFEIVVADDGSKINYFNELITFFEHHCFDKYTLVSSDSNVGTTANALKGVRVARGTYVKNISPGDCFYAEDSLEQWVNYLIKNNKQVSFCDSVYYYINPENKKIELCKEKRRPINDEIYKPNKYKRKKGVYNYILLKDVPNGASFISTKEIVEAYLTKIVNRVKYAEDVIYRLMIVDGVEFIKFSKIAIWYEYGSGISTMKNSFWDEKVHQDMISSNHIMIEKLRNSSFFNKKLVFYLEKCSPKKDWIKYFLFPKVIFWKIKKDKKKSYTPITVDNMDFFNQLFKES